MEKKLKPLGGYIDCRYEISIENYNTENCIIDVYHKSVHKFRLKARPGTDGSIGQRDIEHALEVLSKFTVEDV